jgi:hypothetical protein
MSDSEIACTPPELRESAQKLTFNLLPEKNKLRNEKTTGAIVTPQQMGNSFISDRSRLITDL